MHRKAPQEEDNVLANLPPSRDPQVTQQQPDAQATEQQPDAEALPGMPAPAGGVSARPPPQPARAPETVSVDGLNYVAGEQPQSLGTLGEAPATDAPTPLMPQQAAQSAPQSSYAPAPQSGYAPGPNPGLRPYQPQWSGAPLPNDLVILPNGQMMVPANQ